MGKQLYAETFQHRAETFQNRAETFQQIDSRAWNTPARFEEHSFHVIGDRRNIAFQTVDVSNEIHSTV